MRGHQLLCNAVLLRLNGEGLAIVGGRMGKELGVVGARSHPWDDYEQQCGARAEGLGANVARGCLGNLAGGARPRGGEGVRQLARVARDLLVDLVTQLRPGASIDGHEGDPGADQHDHCHPRCQAPAQSDRSQTPAQACRSKPPRRRRGSRAANGHRRGGSRPCAPFRREASNPT